VTESLEFALVSRLRETLRDHAATEGELRTLREQADGWATALQGQIHAGERRLRRLTDDPGSTLSDIASELRHVDTLRAEMTELSSLLAELEQRTRELRTEWLLRQADSSRL
jgi:chromosome segregation ATPase